MRLPCQDSCDARVIKTRMGENILACVVSDGAGSAKYAELGSHLACSLIMEGIKDFFESGKEIYNLTRDTAERLITDFQAEVNKYSSIMELTPRDFACTLIVSVVGYKNAVFFQIGDGAIVISKAGEEGYSPVFWPSKGEYENSTHFAVDRDSVLIYMKYGLAEGCVTDTAMFTDSLERIALHYKSRSAYEPFFKPLFENVRSISSGRSNELICSMIEFLNSKKVNTRTDDDKTLIIASRCD